MLGSTPTVSQTSLPSVEVTSTRVTASVPCAGLEDADLVVRQVDRVEVGPRAVHGVAEGVVERVDRAVALARPETLHLADLDGQDRLGRAPMRRAAGRLVPTAADGDTEVLGAERLVVREQAAGEPAQQELEGGVGRVVHPAAGLAPLDLGQHLGGLVVGDLEPNSRAFSTMLDRPASSETTSRWALPTSAGSMWLYMSGALARAEACRPALWLNAVCPT